ncbi:hypothetical protein JL721_11461 [Aureococcus anophagefferens]|nr:hypothetical protein JL721_11461 [Aureococcus anophagefferens]
MRCFDGLADLLSGGDAERLEVVFGAFDASMAKRRRVRGASERVLVALKDNIATAWQNHTQVGDYTAATQVLSLAIVPRMRDFGWRDQIRAFVSRVVPVTTGSDVLVLQFPQGVRRRLLRRATSPDDGLDRHALDVASAALTYPGESALPTDQQLLVNPAPFLSPDQKKTAAVAKEAAVEARDAAREERAVARRAPLVATFRNLRPHACPNCLAKFSSPARLRSHRLRGCGSSAAGRAERRLAHDATTIDALLAKSDGDLADALEARAELGLDLVTATFAEGALGFTCEEQLDAAGAPSLFRELAWALPSIPRHLVRGALVRVEAHRLTAARDEVGMGWRSAFYYGTASRNGDIISVLYSGHASGQEHESHFSHVEIGTRPPSSGDVDDRHGLRAPSHHWNEEVAGRLDALLFDPANQRRYENVYNALKSEFEFRRR